MTTDTSEKGLETLIMQHMTGTPGLPAATPTGAMQETSGPPAQQQAGAVKRRFYMAGNPQDYDRDHAVDAVKLFEFLAATQPAALKTLGLTDYKDKEICADKFQTGYDQPLLHTMYVDKPLSGIKAVQTLSRLNRAHPKKHDTFVLDFQNDAETIQKSFEPYYRTTLLSEETDPNKLHDLKADLESCQVYAQTQVEQLVELYLGGAERDTLDPILDACVPVYLALNEDGQVDFKGKAKAFVRTYGFLASILPFTNATWEKLSIFLNFLIPKLPAPIDVDLAKGILEAIDMDSYRVEVRSALAILLADQNAEIEPVPTSGGGRKPEPELDRLSNILRAFNDLWGNIPWSDRDRIAKVIAEELPPRVSADKAYQNAMKNSDRENARIEHDKALLRVMVSLMTDHTELFKQFQDNQGFKKWLADANFSATYKKEAA